MATEKLVTRCVEVTCAAICSPALSFLKRGMCVGSNCREYLCMCSALCRQWRKKMRRLFFKCNRVAPILKYVNQYCHPPCDWGLIDYKFRKKFFPKIKVVLYQKVGFIGIFGIEIRMLDFANRLLKIQKSVILLRPSPSSSATITVFVHPSISSILSSNRSSSRTSRRLFHTSTVSMVAHKIDGTAIAK